MKDFSYRKNDGDGALGNRGRGLLEMWRLLEEIWYT